MNRIESQTLGQTWVTLVRRTLEQGERMDDEGTELLQAQVAFPAANGPDPLLERFADPAMIGEMRKVFFTEDRNELGHSYAAGMCGPGGRADLQDVIELLRVQPWSKRAIVTICGVGNGEVPCINVIHFLVRNGRLETIYFARGQDAFAKFYADGLCVAAMARRVAAALGLPAGDVTGFIASSHIYDRDLAAIRRFLAAAAELASAAKGGG